MPGLVTLVKQPFVPLFHFRRDPARLHGRLRLFSGLIVEDVLMSSAHVELLRIARILLYLALVPAVRLG